MNKILEALLELNEMDKTFLHMKTRIEAGPQELKQLEAAVEEARVACRAAETSIREKASEVDRINLDLKAAEDEVVEQEAKLKTIKNNKEYRIVTDRIKELKQQIVDREDASLKLMETLDGVRAELKEKQAVLAEATATLEKTRERIEQEAETIRAEARECKARRDERVATIRDEDPLAMEIYEQAYRRGRGEAMAEMIGGSCQTCYRRQNPNTENQVMVGRELRKCLCAGCGRLLFSQEALKEAAD